MTIDQLRARSTKLLLVLFCTYLVTACGTTDNPAADISCFTPDGTSLDCSFSSPGPGTDSEPGSGSGTLKNLTISWTAPSARADGTPLPLSEIAGYRIYFGTSRYNYGTTVAIDDGSMVQGTINNLNAGTTYYFVMTTIDTEGRESSFSPEYSVTL